MTKKEMTKSRSLYEISSDIEEIFGKLEENGGELTPEIENSLAIAQDELNDKASKYAMAIQACKMQIDACKKEKQRIDGIKKRNEQSVEYLTEALSNAINKFGQSNKSGNHFLETGFMKLTSVPVTSVDIDQEAISKIVSYAIEYTEEACKNNTLDKELDNPEEYIEHIVNHVNNRLNENIDEDGITYEVNYHDLMNIPVECKTKTFLLDLLVDQPTIESMVNNGNASVEPNVTATYVKQLVSNGKEFRFAKNRIKNSLRIA